MFKHFRLHVIGRIALLSATIYLFFYLLQYTAYYATTLITGLFVLYQIFSLIRYVEKTNRDLGRFFLSIKHADFSQTFVTGGLGSSFDELKQAFNEVLDAFRLARAEKEEHFRYLQTVVQHIGIGLLAFKRNGEVGLINTAAKRLLHVNQLHDIHALERLDKGLVQTLLTLKPRQKTLVKVEGENELLQLAIHATVFRLNEDEYTLVSIQNIHLELEEKEMEAWQNLIRVLTHEIMNSITPITSLAATTNDLLAAEDLDAANADDVRQAVQTIQRRSEGLLHFVQDYRKLTRIPSPNFQIFPIAELFDRLQQLMRSQIDAADAQLHLSVDPHSLELTADPELVEQVLINLLVNAVHALKGQTAGRVDLSARLDGRGHVLIEVIDNGPGIVEEALDKIFIPFFTTKQDGSGIGLSLSRQIMRLHRGNISVHSEPHEKTAFTLRF